MIETDPLGATVDLARNEAGRSLVRALAPAGGALEKAEAV
jgi:hypothetical protein